MAESRLLRSTVRALLRKEMFEGREHLVFPVVALVEGVIFAVNAEAPELVLAEELAKAPEGWNGRPIVMNHPSIEGSRVSANSPEILEQLRLGNLFHAAIDGKKLVVEAYIDPDRVRAVGGDATIALDRILAGETIEVSVGVFVAPEAQNGEYQGQSYVDIWREIVPDHLAFLPEGMVGACSVQMGCGTPRVAARKEEEPMSKPMGKKLWEQFVALKSRFLPAQEGQEQSDSDLRSLLDRELFATEPGYLGIEAVFSETTQIIYAVAPEGAVVLKRRSYSLADGLAVLGNDAEEVRLVSQYEPVVAAASGGGSATQKETARKEEVDMTKRERIAAIIASGKTCFADADMPVLEQFTDERLTAMEAHVKAASEQATPPPPPLETPKTLTPEEEQVAFFAKYPEFGKVIAAASAHEAEKRGNIIKELEASQNVLTGEELKGRSTSDLEMFLALARKKKDAVDFSGAGAPRAAAGETVERAASSAELRALMREKIVSMQGKRATA